MNNDGVVRRPALDFENAPNRLSVQRAGSQPIYGLRWQRDHLSGAQQFRRPLHRGLEQLRRVRRQNFGDDRRLLVHGRNLPANPAKAREKAHAAAV